MIKNIVEAIMGGITLGIGIGLWINFFPHYNATFDGTSLIIIGSYTCISRLSKLWKEVNE